jgi:type IV secretory pathway TrbL component
MVDPLIVYVLAVVGFPMIGLIYLTHFTKYGSRTAWVAAVMHIILMVLLGLALALDIHLVYATLFLVIVFGGFYYWYMRRYVWKSPKDES